VLPLPPARLYDRAPVVWSTQDLFEPYLRCTNFFFYADGIKSSPARPKHDVLVVFSTDGYLF
jgi:hypothetical protein